MEGSGWAVIGVLNHEIHVNKYAPLEARSYIKLPDEIQNKKATVNVHNTDDDNALFIVLVVLWIQHQKNNICSVSVNISEMFVKIWV